MSKISVRMNCSVTGTTDRDCLNVSWPHTVRVVEFEKRCKSYRTCVLTTVIKNGGSPREIYAKGARSSDYIMCDI
jgi:hypothetical protein